MKVILEIFFGYLALYSVIWLHEVGHAIVYYKFNCKRNPFNVSVPFYIFFSTPAPVDMEEIRKLNSKQRFYTSIGGILVNLIFAVPVFIYIKLSGVEIDTSIKFFIYMFTLFHLVEAMSYMVLNNIVVAGDIVSVQNYNPKWRIPIFVTGLLCIYMIIDLINILPRNLKPIIVFTIIFSSTLMGGARVVFTIINNNKKKVKNK